MKEPDHDDEFAQKFPDTFRFTNKERVQIVGSILFGKWDPQKNEFGADLGNYEVEYPLSSPSTITCEPYPEF